jgi:hypothetical protein
MNFFHRFLPRTITGQITCLVIVVVLLGVGLTSTVLFYFFYSERVGVNGEILAAVRAARIAAIVKKAEESRSLAELAQTLDTTRSASVFGERVPISRLASTPSGIVQDSDFVRSIKVQLKETWGIIALVSAPAERNDSIAIKISDDSALVFEVS